MKTLPPQFIWIPVGVEGGLDESSLSAHLIAPIGSTSFVCLDAGTLLAGLKVACRNNCFKDISVPGETDLTIEGYILHNHIKAYLITHPYLDHVEGLVVISPNDKAKPIMGLQGTIEDIKNYLFNWRVWPNFGSEGVPPLLGIYDYETLHAGIGKPISGTSMSVEAFPLAHGNFTDSTAFLIESENSFLLYMGDTGPDEIERRSTTQDLWKRIVPLIKAECLHGIFIETSYPDERPDDQLFSHLTPAWLMRAFRNLAELVNPGYPESALQDLNVIITHIKPDLRSGSKPREAITAQLLAHNDLGLHFIFAEQGKRYEL
jgi:3',5'-cyclic-nucleotide phosphodiesterase